MPRLSNAERNQAVGMLQAGQSKRQVACHFHCSPSTLSRSLTNRGFVCTPSTDVKECGDDLERGMPPAAYISTTDGEVRV